MEVLFVDKHILGTHSAVEDTKASPVFFLHKWINSVYIATSSRRQKHFWATNAPISFGRAYSTLEGKTISMHKLDRVPKRLNFWNRIGCPKGFTNFQKSWINKSNRIWIMYKGREGKGRRRAPPGSPIKLTVIASSVVAPRVKSQKLGEAPQNWNWRSSVASFNSNGRRVLERRNTSSVWVGLSNTKKKKPLNALWYGSCDPAPTSALYTEFHTLKTR